jgi:hypothetical protein
MYCENENQSPKRTFRAESNGFPGVYPGAPSSSQPEWRSMHSKTAHRFRVCPIAVKA